MSLRRLVLCVTSGCVLAAAACGRDAAPAAKVSVFSYLPLGASVVLETPSWRALLADALSVSSFFFGPEGERDVRRKIVAQLGRECGVDLLDPGALTRAGFDTGRPLGVAVGGAGGAYFSLPVADPDRAYAFIRGRFGDALRGESVPPGAPGARQLRAAGATAVFAGDRVFLFTAPCTPGSPLAAGWLAEPDARTAGLRGTMDAAHARHWLPGLAAGPVSFRLSRVPGRLDFEAFVSASAITAAAVTAAATLSAWVGDGIPVRDEFFGHSTRHGMHAALAAPRDLLFASLTLRLDRIWGAELRPRLLAQAERQAGKVGTMLSRLLGGEKSLIEKVLDSLEVETRVLPALTGDVALVLFDLDAAAVADGRPLDAPRGALLLETTNAAAAALVLEHLAAQGARFDLPFEKLVRADRVLWRVPLFRFGIPRAVFLAVAGPRIAVSLLPEDALAFSADGSSRGDPGALLGPAIAGALVRGPARGVASLAVRHTLERALAAFDDRTRANLAPFLEQLGKATRFAACELAPAGAGPATLLATLAVAGEWPAVDPFTAGGGGPDWIMLAVGLAAAAAIALLLIRSGLRRRRERE